MAIPMISITPLQHNPRNSLLDTDGLVRGLNDYRKGAETAYASEQVGRTANMSPEEGYRHLMSAGLPDHARAVGLYPLQRDALSAETGLTRARATATANEDARAGAIAPWQRLHAMQTYRHLISQGRLVEAQAILASIQGRTAQTQTDMQQRILNQLLENPAALGAVGTSAWNPIIMGGGLPPMMGGGPTITPPPGFTYTPR